MMAIRRPQIRGGRWKVPSVGSKARGKLPAHVFLDQRGRRYPVKVYRGGKWVNSPQGLMAAYRRAGQQRDRAIQQKALRRLNPIRIKQGKPTLPLKTR